MHSDNLYIIIWKKGVPVSKHRIAIETCSVRIMNYVAVSISAIVILQEETGQMSASYSNPAGRRTSLGLLKQTIHYSLL